MGLWVIWECAGEFEVVTLQGYLSGSDSVDFTSTGICPNGVAPHATGVVVVVCTVWVNITYSGLVQCIRNVHVQVLCVYMCLCLCPYVCVCACM